MDYVHADPCRQRRQPRSPKSTVARPIHATPALTRITTTTNISHSATSHTLGSSPHVDRRAGGHIHTTTGRIGFIPGTHNQTLTIKHARVVTILIARPLDRLFDSPACDRFLDNVARRLSRSSCLPIVLRTSSARRHGHTHRRFRHHSFSTIVSISPCGNDRLLRILHRLNMPAILYNRLRNRPCHSIFSAICSSSRRNKRFTTLTVGRHKHGSVITILKPRSGPTIISHLHNCHTILNRSLPSTGIVCAN